MRQNVGKIYLLSLESRDLSFEMAFLADEEGNVGDALFWVEGDEHKVEKEEVGERRMGKVGCS